VNQDVDSVDACLNLILMLQKLELGIIRITRTSMAFELSVLLDEGKDALCNYRREYNSWG